MKHGYIWNMKKGLPILTLLIAFVISYNTFASKINASTFGWNATDATTAFVNAINSSYDTIVIDKQVGDWMINSTNFTALNSKTIFFENGVNLVARPGAFSNIYASLMTFYECNNVKIIGYGATFKMQKSEYIVYNDSEHRHCIQLISCNYIDVYGLKLMDSGGDGIIVASYTGITTQRYSANIFLKDLWCDNNYRQGISVISVEHLRVENCWFTNTSGTAPQAGLDLEPNQPFERLVDVVFEKCRFTGNVGGGILIAPISIDSTTLPMDITFNNCYIANNGTNKYQISTYGYASGATGNVTFNNCMTDGGTYSVGGTKLASGYKANFNNCVFRNPENIVLNLDDHTTSASLIRNGGMSFTNCLAFYNTTYRYFNVWHANATSAGLDDVQFNNFTVINANNVSYNDGGNITGNCVFNFQQFSSVPSTTVSYTLGNSMIECDTTNSLLNFSRDASSDITFPIGMTYSIADTGIQGEDYSRMKGFEIIPFGNYAQEDTFFVLADEVAEIVKQNAVTLDTSWLYSTTSSSQSVTILDCIISEINESNLSNEAFSVYPNPASEFLNIYINSQNSEQSAIIYFGTSFYRNILAKLINFYDNSLILSC